MDSSPHTASATPTLVYNNVVCIMLVYMFNNVVEVAECSHTVPIDNVGVYIAPGHMVITLNNT